MEPVDLSYGRTFSQGFPHEFFRQLRLHALRQRRRQVLPDVIRFDRQLAVTAVDVGYGQLDFGLRNDGRVRVLEQTNARVLDAELLPEPIDLVVIDVSFISARLLLPVLAAVVSMLEPGL